MFEAITYSSATQGIELWASYLKLTFRAVRRRFVAKQISTGREIDDIRKIVTSIMKFLFGESSQR